MVTRTGAKTRQNIKQRHGSELEALGRMETRWEVRCAQGPLTSGEVAADHRGRLCQTRNWDRWCYDRQAPQVYSDPPLTEYRKDVTRPLRLTFFDLL